MIKMEQNKDHALPDETNQSHSSRDKHPHKTKTLNGDKHRPSLEKKEIYGQHIPEGKAKFILK